MNANLYLTLRLGFPANLDAIAIETDQGLCYSWRDIERRYDKDRAMYAPDPSYKVARIRLFKDTQADKVEQVKKMLAEKK